MIKKKILPLSGPNPQESVPAAKHFPLPKSSPGPKIDQYLQDLLVHRPELAPLEQAVREAYDLMTSVFSSGGKALICGNGGSAADSDHIVGELMKGFYKERRLPADEIERLGPGSRLLQGALPAISLVHPAALITAFSNDVDPEMAFAQQVYGLGYSGDLLIGISTSGNAANVVHAAEIARALGLSVLTLTGASGGKLKTLSDICLAVPETITARVQELHLPIYHTLCAMVEEHFFG